jgi:hypothetical protein
VPSPLQRWSLSMSMRSPGEGSEPRIRPKNRRVRTTSPEPFNRATHRHNALPPNRASGAHGHSNQLGHTPPLVGCSGLLGSARTSADNCRVALAAQEDVGTIFSDPAQRHGLDSVLASLAVFMIPGAFREREPGVIVVAAFVENQNAMTSLDWEPATETRAAHDIVKSLFIFTAGRYEHFESVERGDSTFFIGPLPEFCEFGIHFSLPNGSAFQPPPAQPASVASR